MAKRNMTGGMREVSVRKIGNGYLRKETTYEDGEYATSEYYHRENPGLEHNPDTGPDDRRGEQLSEAIRVLKGP